MGGLGNALVWYQKKIGSYDKQLWETTVEQHILSGMNSLPKKTTKLKTELIDVDLVRGSTFPKAKPQHGWISTTASGVIRTLLLPVYCAWWHHQTSTEVCGAIFLLYFLQIVNLSLYFVLSPDDSFQDVPSSEVITPLVMMLILGVMQSQIVATVSTKSSHKSVLRAKSRKRIKRKSRTRSVPPTCGCKSYPENALDNKPTTLSEKFRSQSSGELESLLSKEKSNYSGNNSLAKGSQCTRLKNSDEESGLDSLDFTHAHELPRESGISSLPVTDSKDSLCSSVNEERQCCSKYESDGDISSEMLPREKAFPKNSEDIDFSSGDEYFIAKHRCCEGDCKSESHSRTQEIPKFTVSGEIQMPLYWRRFSDFERKQIRESSVERCKFAESSRRLSEGLVTNRSLKLITPLIIEDKSFSIYGQNYIKSERNCRNLHIPVKRDFCSSCESDGDTAPNSPTKADNSDSEWPVITNTDCNSDSTDSVEASQDDSPSLAYEDPLILEMQDAPGQLFSAYTGSDKGRRPPKVSCTIWERNECKKVDLTVLDISSAIIQKVDALGQSSEYLVAGLICSFFIALLPSLYRLQNVTIMHDVTSDVLLLSLPSTDEVVRLTGALQSAIFGETLRNKAVVIISLLERFLLGAIYFFLLSVAERTFKQRFLYAKHFCHLTSARRARRSDLPHFRLNKVRNIKTWLSVRSYLKKQGPQRSVDVVVSTSFIISISLLSFLCLQLLKETDDVLDHLYCWEIVCWCLILGLFLMRFMILGSKINKKYRNLSVLLTEQINLYLHMEQKPHKKEELILANNVLKLAADLLKELESPFKISGLCANPYLYNVTKVVVLSAFSAVLTELLGFKLKLHKIKIK